MTSPLKMGDVLSQDRPRRMKPGNPEFVGPPKPPKAPKRVRKTYRFDAYLKRYGPKEAPSRLVLILESHNKDTPEDFYLDLVEEKKVSGYANSTGYGTRFRLDMEYRRL